MKIKIPYSTSALLIAFNSAWRKLEEMNADQIESLENDLTELLPDVAGNLDLIIKK